MSPSGKKSASARLERKSRRAWRTAFSSALLLGLSLSSRVLALDVLNGIADYNCQTWTRQNGLPVNGINAIVQTKDGYLWMGTSAGLVRFDGTDFKQIDLARMPHVLNGTVASLSSAQDGGLWVGLENSAFGFYDGKVFSFRGKETQGRLDMNVRTILESKDGTLWLMAQRQVSKLTKEGGYEEVFGTSAATERNILCAHEDAESRIWFGTANHGLFYWQAGKVTKFPDETLGDRLLIHCVAQDLEGQIWVGTDRGLRCYGADFRRREIPLLEDEIQALLVDRHGVVWIGTQGRGLGRYQNGNYDFLSKPDGLASAYVNTLAEDREGSLWVGTREGVSQLTDVKFPTHSAAEDPRARQAWSVAASRRGGVWIGGSAGVTYFDGKTTTYPTGSRPPYAPVKRVFEASNGDLYLVLRGEARNLAVFSGGRVVANYTAPNMLVGMGEDASGVIVSVAGSLYRVGPGGLTPYVFTGGEPDLQWVLNLAPGRDGAIWVACGTGIFRVKGGAFESWPTIPVLGICEDSDGVVWGVSLSGIVRLKNNQIRIINRDDGLFDNNIFAIVPDDFGNLWVDSGRGIFRVSRQSMNDFADGKTTRVDCLAYDGPESVKTTDKTMQERVGCKSLDGRIWFPGPQGVVTIDPAHIPVNPIAPPVYIDRVVANGGERTMTADTLVAPGKGELEFHFAALSYIAPQKIKFRYQLEGYDKDWVEAGDRRLAIYTNLKPGPYTFRVIAANADGVWNKAGDSLRVQLLPHFYQTAWFYALCIGSLGAALAGIYLWRIRHLNQRQRKLQEARDHLEVEVQNRTVELGTANTSLKHEIDEHQRTVAELEQRTRSLENQIEERKKMQLEIERVHGKLLETSRQAGMAEVATGVLHNVGNVLNSVNVSAGLLADQVRRSKVTSIAKVSNLLGEHEVDLGAFLTADPRGRQVPAFLRTLAAQLAMEQDGMLKEVDSLRKNIEHIKDIVAMQQNYAKVSGVTEKVAVTELVADALHMNSGALVRHEVALVTDYQAQPVIFVEKHKVLQILVNLMRNAKYACDDSGRSDKQMTIRVTADATWVRIAVIDNGVGIPAENRIRIFAHGFTTRQQGHGFGLHSCALAAKALRGSLTAHSDGAGQGAVFTLEIPLAASQTAA